MITYLVTATNGCINLRVHSVQLRWDDRFENRFGPDLGWLASQLVESNGIKDSGLERVGLGQSFMLKRKWEVKQRKLKKNVCKEVKDEE